MYQAICGLRRASPGAGWTTFEAGIRGGQSVIFEKFAEANNQYMDDYNAELDKIFITHQDANNLYGWTMSKQLPISGFKWMEPLTEEFSMTYDEETNDKGYTLVVDLHDPEGETKEEGVLAPHDRGFSFTIHNHIKKMNMKTFGDFHDS